MRKLSSEATGESFRAGELAKLCGVSTDTLRHYERIGVLPKPQRTAAGYRKYPPGAVARVQLVRRALNVGFTLAELARIFRIRDSGGAPCQQVRALAAEKVVQLERRLEELKSLKRALNAILIDWDQRLEQAPSGSRAGLLEALAQLPSAKGGLHENNAVRRGPRR